MSQFQKMEERIKALEQEMARKPDGIGRWPRCGGDFEREMPTRMVGGHKSPRKCRKSCTNRGATQACPSRFCAGHSLECLNWFAITKREAELWRWENHSPSARQTQTQEEMMALFHRTQGMQLGWAILGPSVKKIPEEKTLGRGDHRRDQKQKSGFA